jgi:hypothetical protein
VSIVFSILSIKRENLCFLKYFVRCRKRGRITRGIFGKVIINEVENSKRSYKKGQENFPKGSYH